MTAKLVRSTIDVSIKTLTGFFRGGSLARLRTAGGASRCAQMVLPKSLANQFVLVTCNVGGFVGRAKIEDCRYVDFGLRTADILRYEQADVFSEGNAKL